MVGSANPSLWLVSESNGCTAHPTVTMVGSAYCPPYSNSCTIVINPMVGSAN
ncbi:MAG: hypothetical protein F6K56_40860, partial [Moorea sp. SIO3G5]|nr:hypothetical protein [Moorena sp. SIO3G5]